MTDLQISLAMAATILGTFINPLLAIVAMAAVLIVWYGIPALAWWTERRDRTQQRHQHTTERDQERAL